MRCASKKVGLSFICERAPATLRPRTNRKTRWSSSVANYDSKSISRSSIERRFMSAIIQASPVEKLSQEPLPADSFGDAHLYRSRPDVMSQEGLSPERELPLADRTGEKPSLSVDGSAQRDAKPEEPEPNVDRGGLAFGMLLFCTDRLIV